MIVLGSLEFLMGIYYLVIGFLMPDAIEAQIRSQRSMGAEEKLFMKQVLWWTFVGMGGGGILGGLMRLAGGIQVVRFRSHALGIAGNIVGLASISTCYCSPFSLGVSIYGLIILFHSSVRQEFARRAL